MRKYFLFFILISFFNIFSLEKKVLIMPFKNNSDKKNDFYSDIILGTIKSEIVKLTRTFQKEEFENEILKKIKSEEDKGILLSFYKLDFLGKNYVLKETIDYENEVKIKRIFSTTGYEDIYIPVTLDDLKVTASEEDKLKKAIKENLIENIITGYYFEEHGQIAINFKIIDTKTESLKLSYSTYGQGEENIFEVIFDGIAKFIDKLKTEVRKEKRQLGLLLREKQSRIISGELKEFFLFLNSGILLNTMNFVYTKIYDDRYIDIASKKNKYNLGFSPVFNFEIYSSVKNNYHGFGFNLNIPFVYDLPNIQIIERVILSYIYGYKKIYFFDFSLGIYYKHYNKFGDEIDKIKLSRITVNFLALIIGFKFRYIPTNLPFYLMGGFYFLPPKFNINDLKNSSDVSLWNIATRWDEAGYVSRYNFIFPVIPLLGIGVFFNKEMGIYVSSSFYLFRVLYKGYKHDFYDKVILLNLGWDLSLNFDIEFGLVFKSIFK